jgi:hypothetical protein
LALLFCILFVLIYGIRECRKIQWQLIKIWFEILVHNDNKLTFKMEKFVKIAQKPGRIFYVLRYCDLSHFGLK